MSLTKRMILIMTAMLLLTLVFYSPGLNASGLQGKAYVTVLNSEPVILDIGVYEGANETRIVQTDLEYEYRVHLKDANTIADIYEVRVELWLWRHKDTGTEVNKKPDMVFIYLDEEPTSSLDGDFFQIEPKNGDDLDRIGVSHISAQPMDSNGTWSFMVTITKAKGCDRMQVKTNVTDGSYDNATMVSEIYIIEDWAEDYSVSNPASTVEDLGDITTDSDGGSPAVSKLLLLALAGSVSCVLTFRLMYNGVSQKLKTRDENRKPRYYPS